MSTVATAKSFADVTHVDRLWEISRLCLCRWRWLRARRPWRLELAEIHPQCRFHGGRRPA